MSANESSLRLPFFLAWLRPWSHLDGLAWLTAAKAALATCIAIGLAMGLGWERPYWSGISVVVVMLPYVGASLEKGIMRLTGTIAAGVVTYLIAGAFPQNQLGYGALLFALIAFTGYMSVGRVYAYAFQLCGITAAIINAEVINDLDGLWSVVFYRVSEICLGVVVAVAVNALVFPQSAGRLLGRNIATTMQDCIRLLEHTVSVYTRGQPLVDDADKLTDKLNAQFPKLRGLLPQAILDSSRFSHHRTSLEAGMQFMESTFISVVTTLRAVQGDFPKKYQENLLAEQKAFTDALLEEMRALAAYFQDQTPLPESHLAAMHQQIEQRLEKLRAAGTPKQYDLDDTTGYLAFYANLYEIERALTLLRKAVIGMQNPGQERREVKERLRRLKKPWHPDIPRIKHGIKIGIAVIVAIYLWQWTQFPGGLTSVVTAAIIMQTTVVASNRKSALRLFGCFFGGIVGAVFLLFAPEHLTTYAQFAPCMFACFMLFGIVKYGPETYAYAGFQAMLAFLLMTSISNTQDLSLKPGIERLLGILFGVMICAVVLRLIWPVVPEQQLLQTLTKFFRGCHDYLQLYTTDVLRGKQPIAVVGSLDLGMINLPTACKSWITQVGFRKSEADQHKRYQQLALSLQSLRFRLQALERVIRRPLDTPLSARIAPTMEEVNQRLQETFAQLAKDLKAGKTAATYPDLDTPIQALNKELHAMLREDNMSRPLAATDVAVFLALVRRYNDLSSEAIHCRQLLAGLDLSIMDRTPFI